MVNATFEIKPRDVGAAGVTGDKAKGPKTDPEDLLRNLGMFTFKVEGECDVAFAKKLVKFLNAEGARQKEADKKAEDEIER